MTSAQMEGDTMCESLQPLHIFILYNVLYNCIIHIGL